MFDGIYTGTETRDPEITDQLLQQYESYQIYRYLRTSARRELGVWADTYDTRAIDRYAEQLWDTTVRQGARTMLFNWSPMAEAKPATAGNSALGEARDQLPLACGGRRMGERGQRSAARRRRRTRRARKSGRRRELPTAARDRRGLPPQLHRQPRRADRTLSRLSGECAYHPLDPRPRQSIRRSSPRSTPVCAGAPM